MKIQIPLPEKLSTNLIYAGLHYRVRKAHADLYHQALIEFTNLKVEKYPVDTVYTFDFKKNALDSSNCSYSAKMLEDSMVKWGILENDSPKFVRSVKLISQKKGDRDLVTIEIHEQN